MTSTEQTHEESESEWEAVLDDGLCDRCGGEGWIMASDGDGNDWGEDTYCGPLDETIDCRACRGTGMRR